MKTVSLIRNLDSYCESIFAIVLDTNIMVKIKTNEFQEQFSELRFIFISDNQNQNNDNNNTNYE